MRSSTCQRALFAGIFFAAAVLAAAPVTMAESAAVVAVDPPIDASRGVDARVDYAGLTRYGPWDDRNYALTAEDVALLPKRDEYLPRVPAFFKVLKRREYAAQGTPLIDVYPREIHFEFYYRYGGLMRNGEIELTSLGKYYYPDPSRPRFPEGTRVATVPMAAPIEGEGPLAIGTNETSVAVNPANPDIVIAGSNGAGGQNQNYSTDGGITWAAAGVLPNTCCDPALEWSVDGTVAYAATLGASSSGGVAGFRATVFRSTDGGMTWGDRRDVSDGDSDKEFIHVDRSPGSPYYDTVYLTWHQGNVMHFSRSIDRALTWSPPIPLPQGPRGIGSDITTDALGNVYYFYPTLDRPGGQAIVMLKSSDGGVSWTPPVVVATLKGRFNFAVPSMDGRKAAIYVSADVDRLTNRIWVAWADLTPASAGSNAAPSLNVGWIRIASSADGGVTWTQATTPHAPPLPPGPNAVDRYNPWLAVDGDGMVHLTYYDTRHSTDRTGVDAYYIASIDNGASWFEETRVSGQTSVRIDNPQQWGDYNGLAVNAGRDNVVMTWTDNRLVGGGPQQRTFAGRVTNTLTDPTFVVGIDGAPVVVGCPGEPLPPIGIAVTGVLGFGQPVALAIPALDPAFGGGVFAPNPVVAAAPPALSVLSGLVVASDAPPGTRTIGIQASSGTQVRATNVAVDVFRDTLPPAVPVAPADGAAGVATSSPFIWDALPDATGYQIQIATDAAFTNIVDTGTTTVARYTSTSLRTATTYYWRVRGVTPCGEGEWSEVSSLVTAIEFCRTPDLAIPDGAPEGVADELLVTATGEIESLQVRVRIEHGFVGDLHLILTNDGTPVGPVPLLDRPGFPALPSGCDGADVDAVFDDFAAEAAETQCNPTPPAISGAVFAKVSLSSFAEQELSGAWRLQAIDAVPGDAGTLLEWCLAAGGDIRPADDIFTGNFECDAELPGCPGGAID